MLLLTAGVFADEPKPKLPVPSADAQAESLKTVKETFKNEYAKKSAADAAVLAKKLFDAAVETKDNPTDRYVLLLQAQYLAVRARDAGGVTRAIDQLAADFTVDSLTTKAKALAEMAKMVLPSEASADLLKALIETAEEAVGADQYLVANQLLVAAKPVAHKASEKQLNVRLDRLAKDLSIMQRRYDDAKPAIATLKTRPDDPDSNLNLGMFLCFWKANWDDGLPKLAKGSDAKVKALALRELQHPQESSDKGQLGDAWWALADGESEPARQNLRQHATVWYSQALPGLSGLAKIRIEKRIQETETSSHSAAPQEVRSKVQEVNLLKLADTKRDAVHGTWQLRNGELICTSAEHHCRFEFPYEPPEEYDFQVAFARLEGHDCVLQLCAVGEHRFMWLMDGHTNKMGFDYIDGKDIDTNPTGLPYRLQNGQRYVSLVKVRKNGVQAFLDGRLVDQWKTDYKDMSSPDQYALHNLRTLGVAAWESPTIFYSAKVTEITGTGKRLTQQ
jgi:hypothetical protein